jgi:hypothetical protein
MVLMDDPQTVVDTIVWASIHPTKESSVGWKAQTAVTAHRLLPNLTEHIAGDVYQRVQIETAPQRLQHRGRCISPCALAQQWKVEYASGCGERSSKVVLDMEPKPNFPQRPQITDPMPSAVLS